MATIYKLDGGRTRELYRAIAANSRAGLRNLLLELGRMKAMVSEGPLAFKDAGTGEIRALHDDLEDISAIWMTLAMDGEPLDRDQDWDRLGVWVPAT